MCSERGSHWITVRGSPIRTSTDHGMCAPPRRLSQLTTSFIAYTRLGIHRVPLVACQTISPLQQTSRSLLFSRPALKKRAGQCLDRSFFYSTVKEPRVRKALKSKTSILVSPRRAPKYLLRPGARQASEAGKRASPMKDQTIDVSKLDRRVCESWEQEDRVEGVGPSEV